MGYECPGLANSLSRKWNWFHAQTQFTRLCLGVCIQKVCTRRPEVHIRNLPRRRRVHPTSIPKGTACHHNQPTGLCLLSATILDYTPSWQENYKKRYSDLQHIILCLTDKGRQMEGNAAIALNRRIDMLRMSMVYTLLGDSPDTASCSKHWKTWNGRGCTPLHHVSTLPLHHRTLVYF